MQVKIKELEASKQGGFFSSVAGYFGFGKKTAEEEEEERKKEEAEKAKLMEETLHHIQQ